MKPLPLLCAIIGLNTLWLPGLRELSSERGNPGVCPQLRSSPLAPAWILLPGYLSESSQRCHGTAFAGPRPSPVPLALETMGESVPPHPLPRVGVGAQGGNARRCRRLGERHPQGPQPDALRQMKSVPQMRRSSQVQAWADGNCWSALCEGSLGSDPAPAFPDEPRVPNAAL